MATSRQDVKTMVDDFPKTLFMCDCSGQVSEATAFEEVVGRVRIVLKSGFGKWVYSPDHDKSRGGNISYGWTMVDAMRRMSEELMLQAIDLRNSAELKEDISAAILMRVAEIDSDSHSPPPMEEWAKQAVDAALSPKSDPQGGEP